MMKIFQKNLNNNSVKIVCYIFILLIIITAFGINKVQAQWESPTNEPPQSNIYTPLNVGPDKQAKEGNLLLDALFNPYGQAPQIDYPLEVRGSKDVYINYFEVVENGDLNVDQGTLYVNGETGQVGIGSDSFVGDAVLEIHGGSVNIGTASSGVTGYGLNASSTNNLSEILFGMTNTNLFPSIYGQGQGNSIGVYGLNASSGIGIFAQSTDASAVVGSNSSIYDSSLPTKIAGIYGIARGLGSWAGYFEQRLYGTNSIVGRKFLPNRLQNSQIPYTAGWKVRAINDSELIEVHIMAFDGQYIWAQGGYWNGYNPEFIVVIDPDTMEIVQKIILGDTGNHNFRQIISAGGYIWAAHNYCNGGGCENRSAITRIDPNDYSRERYVLMPPRSNQYYSEAISMIYDDVTAGGPYLWVVSEVGSDFLVSGDHDTYAITQMTVDGTVIRTFKLDATPNGGVMCEKFNNQACADRRDNDTDVTIDSGLCVEAPTPADEATCEALTRRVWTAGICQDRQYDTQVLCEANCGANCWAPPTCSKSSCNQVQCGGATACTGGIWDSNNRTCDDSNCLSETTCNGGCPSTWALPETQCVPRGCGGIWNGSSCDDSRCPDESLCIAEPIGNSTNDEQVHIAEIGIPTGITFDGTYIWLSFSGDAYNSDYPTRYRYASEGYARFKASDPENAADQYVYCSGPATAPRDIVYDYITDHVWMPYAHRNPSVNRGLVSVDRSTGAIASTSPQLFGAPWNLEYDIKFFADSPGGPSLWIDRHDRLFKVDPSNPSVIVQAYQNTAYGMDLQDFDFDARDPDNPVIWQLTDDEGVILEHTMDDPPGYNTTSHLIKGANVQKLLFDGTNIWAANGGSTLITKYNARDGSKVGDYDVGANANRMIYDGSAIWIPYHYNNSMFKKLDIKTGVIDEYRVTVTGGYSYTEYINDVTYDGHNIWLTSSEKDHLVRIDLSTCGDVVLGECADGIRIVSSNDPLNLAYDPNKILYDGESLWVSYNDNRISKVSTSGVVEATLTIPQLVGDRITAMEYDGTYIWIGADTVGADGNSVYKINPKGIDNSGAAVGACRDNGNACNYDTNCGGSDICDVVIDGEYPIFYQHGGDADGYTNVTTLTFDGLYMWVTHRAYSDPPNSTDPPSCNDNLDNDGNGMCDFDGSVGTPGCSGRPDPHCDSATDITEEGDTNQRVHLTRIVAATGEIVESMPVRSFGNDYNINSTIFDGQSIWIGGRNFDNNTLAQYYSGSGMGVTDLANNILLRDNIPSQPSFMQSGGISVRGQANYGERLVVARDLVVQNNTWGNTADSLYSFGTSCDEGEFVKGVNTTANQIQCRSL